MSTRVFKQTKVARAQAENSFILAQAAAALANPSTVDFATADWTATQPSDYASNSGTVSFAAGETTKTFTVVVNSDTAVELDETFNVNLSTLLDVTLTTRDTEQSKMTTLQWRCRQGQHTRRNR